MPFEKNGLFMQKRLVPLPGVKSGNKNGNQFFKREIQEFPIGFFYLGKILRWHDDDSCMETCQNAYFFRCIERYLISSGMGTAVSKFDLYSVLSLESCSNWNQGQLIFVRLIKSHSRDSPHENPYWVATSDEATEAFWKWRTLIL